MSTPVTAELSSWLAGRLEDEARAWFSDRRASLEESYSDRVLHITFGMIPRRLGKADLELTPVELEAAARLRPGWDPRAWSVTDAARILVLLQTAKAGSQPFADRFTDLCRTADVGELISLYRGLPLYPDLQILEPQAGEGLRSNMRTVFEAVAHANPYPREVLSEARWNQMVLKALFVDSALAPVQGLDERANPDLAAMLLDYAHERWAAGRPVSPELWRCVGPFATGTAVADLGRVLAAGGEAEREAAALALAASPYADAAEALAGVPDLNARIAHGTLSWARLELWSE